MKKTILILLAVWVGLYFVLSFLDSSDYAMEKKLWYAQKQFELLSRDPKAVPDQNFDDLIRQYEKIIKQYPTAPLTPNIYTKIGNIYILRKDYIKARANYQEVLKRYPKKDSLCAEALLQIGNSYAAEQKIETAVKTYQEVQARYPLTLIGLNMPLYISDFYTQRKDLTEAANVLKSAVLYYQSLAKDHPNSEIEFEARWLLGTTYFMQQRWEQGIQTLGELLDDFAKTQYLNPRNAENIVKTINTISVLNLKNYDFPVNLYKNFIKKNPKHPLNNYLENHIKGLQFINEKEAASKIKPAAASKTEK